MRYMKFMRFLCRLFGHKFFPVGAQLECEGDDPSYGSVVVVCLRCGHLHTYHYAPKPEPEPEYQPEPGDVQVDEAAEPDHFTAAERAYWRDKKPAKKRGRPRKARNERN